MSKLVENYLLQEPIGKGVYGQVFRAIHQKTKLQYAVKVIPKSSFKSNPKLQQLAINEINILSTLKNENIVKFIQTLKTPNNFYFVYEYCNGGTLETLLQKKRFLREDEALIIFKQLLDAFKELNKNNIMHRDLKPDNIFFTGIQVKLGDFGFCKMLEVNMAQTMLGSPIYMAPEILKQQIYTLKADIWSLGVVLFQMLFGYCPFESNSISQLINVIKETQLKIPKEINPISQQCEVLIKKMLVKDQFKRIEWVDLFDFKIDDLGHIISGYKKDLGIETLQRYFLYDVKSTSEIDFYDKKEIKGVQQTQRQILKQGVESDKVIISNKQLNDKKQIVEPVNAVWSPSQNRQELKDIYNNIQLKKQQSKTTNESFVEKHNRWLKGIQLLDELSDCSDTINSEMLFYYVIIVMIKEINEQYQNHPEWTDVLMQEKRSLQDSLKALGRQEMQLDIRNQKKEILRIWRSGEERWKLMWGRAIRFIYHSEPHSGQLQIQNILG